jgi:hypothetical protein
MSMMTSAVFDQSRSIGPGSATTVLWVGYLALVIDRSPSRTIPDSELSKAHAIVYNGARRWRRLESSIKFKWLIGQRGGCLFFVRGLGQGSLHIRWARCMHAHNSCSAGREKKL